MTLVLMHATKYFKALQGIKHFSDLPGYLNPPITFGDQFRPDLFLMSPSHCLYILKMTVGYESNLVSSSIRKEEKYRQLIVVLVVLKPQYRQVEFVNLAMGALGVMSKSSTSFLEIMKELYFNENARKFTVRS